MAKKSSFGLGLALLAGVGVAVIAGIIGYQYWDSQVATQAPKSTPIAVELPALDTSPTQTTGTDGQAPSESAISQAALIINEPSPTPTATPAPAPVVAASPATLTTALENGVKPPPAALEKALQAPTTPVASSVAVPAPKDKTASTAIASQPKQLAAAARTTPPTAPPPSVPPAVAAEKDVSLLAAIVAHNSANASKAQASNASSAGQAPTPAQDTSRPAEESAESLLRRCAVLDADRQASCRAKACSGPRATEAACKPVAASPAPTAPAAAAPSSTSISIPDIPALSAAPALPALPSLTPPQ